MAAPRLWTSVPPAITSRARSRKVLPSIALLADHPHVEVDPDLRREVGERPGTPFMLGSVVGLVGPRTSGLENDPRFLPLLVGRDEENVDLAKRRNHLPGVLQELLELALQA